MKHKKDNNLILVKIHCQDGLIQNEYFTSLSGAGLYLGVAAQSIKWAINHHNILVNNEGLQITIEMVDGSEIPYKLIND